MVLRVLKLGHLHCLIQNELITHFLSVGTYLSLVNLSSLSSYRRGAPGVPALLHREVALTKLQSSLSDWILAVVLLLQFTGMKSTKEVASSLSRSLSGKQMIRLNT